MTFRDFSEPSFFGFRFRCCYMKGGGACFENAALAPPVFVCLLYDPDPV